MSTSRIWIGAVTTLMFGVVGVMFLMERRWVVGGAILALGLLRAGVLWRQVAANRER